MSEPTQAEAYAGIIGARAKAVHEAMQLDNRERRQGKTGVWTFVMETDGGTVLATSEWGTNYEFARPYWEALPLEGALP